MRQANMPPWYAGLYDTDQQPTNNYVICFLDGNHHVSLENYEYQDNGTGHRIDYEDTNKEAQGLKDLPTRNLDVIV